MAEIQDAVVISTLVNQDKLKFPVRAYTESDVAVVTTSRNTVSLIKAQDAKPFKSWSTPQNRPFTCSVITDQLTSQLLCVQNSLVIRKWETNSDSINNALKIKVSHPVHELISLCGIEPLVVFENGCCHLLSKVADSEIDGCLLQDERILRTEAHAGKETIKVIHHVTLPKSSTHIFYHLQITLDSKVTFVKRSTLESEPSAMVSWCLVNDLPEAPLAVLLSNGEIRRYSPELESHNIVCQLPSSQFLAFECVDASHIVVASVCDDAYFLELWDINFKVLKKKRKLDFVLHPDTQMKLVCDGLCLVSGNQVLFSVLSIGSSCLSSSIGQFPTVPNSSLFASKYSWNSDGTTSKEVSDLESKTISLICKDLFDELLKRRDSTGIIKALCKLQDIPESEIVRIMTYFLDLQDSELERYFDDCDNFNNDVFSAKKSYCLNQVLSLPYNDVFLQPHLRKISTDRTKLLLKFLHSHLRNHPMGFGNNQQLSVAQAVSWISLLFDVHFNFLTLTSDPIVQDLLIQLNETVSYLTNLYNEMDDLAHWIDATVAKISIPVSREKSLYRIEILEL